MATKVGINGFGRIGRQVFKAIRDDFGDSQSRRRVVSPQGGHRSRPRPFFLLKRTGKLERSMTKT